MDRLSHKAAESLAARAEAGGGLSQFERMCLEVHLEDCEACAARHRRMSALAQALRRQPEAVAQVSDREVVARALMQAGRTTADVPVRSRPRVRYAWAAAALVLLGLGAFGMLRMQAPLQAKRTTPVRKQVAPHAPVASATETSTDVATSSLTTESTAKTSPVGVAPLDTDGRDHQPCRGVKMTAAAGGTWQVTLRDANVCRLALRSGTLNVQVDPRARMRVSIDTPDATVRVVGTVFQVAADSPRTHVTVYRGKVALETSQATRLVPAGRRAASGQRDLEPAHRETLVALADFVGDDPPSRPRGKAARGPGHSARAKTASGDVNELRHMLHTGKAAEARAEAQSRTEQERYAAQRPDLLTIVAESYVMEGRHAQALETYRHVWRQGRSATAANALIAAANLSLDRLRRPADAVGLFERYLRTYSKGSLQEVAAVGRCRALRAAGHLERASSCAEAYLSVHPDGRFQRQMEALIQ